MTKKQQEQELDEESGTRDFGVFLRDLNEGRFLGECAGELKVLVKALTDHAQAKGGKAKGKLIVTLTLMQDGDVVAVLPDVKLAKPPKTRGPTWMFKTDAGALSLERERQTRLPIREVKALEPKQVEVPEAAQPRRV